MKSGNSNKRTMVLLLILGVLLVIAYSMSGSSSTPVATEDQAVASDEVVTLLTKLQSVDFNFSVLNNTAFAYLKNISNPLLNLPVGRADPFAPVR